MTKVHELKTLEDYYEAVVTGQKKAELRFNDRDFKVGDILRLLKTSSDGYHLGFSIYARITHIVFEGPWLKPGYVMLSIEPAEHERKQ